MIFIELKNEKSMISMRMGVVLFLVAIMCLSSGSVSAEELSEYHALNMDPIMKKKVGPKVIGEVTRFFVSAEKAIESRNIGDLMSLYSSGYTNGRHDKKSAERIWKRIFKIFDNMATIHNMRLVTYAPESNLIIIRCSGLLLGRPLDGEDQELISVDSWTNENHILSKSSGKWMLIGTSGGKERKRFWFDKSMHPLF